MRGRFRRARRLLLYGAVRFLQFLTRHLSRPASLRAFAGIGSVVYRFDRAASRRSLAHLDLAFGDELSPSRKEEIVREMFRATARNVADVLRMPILAREERLALVDFHDTSHLDAALMRGRGAFILAAHFGNWEVLGAALAARGHRLHVVVRELFDARCDRLLNDIRRSVGLVVHPRSRGLRQVVTALREGDLVGTLVDQDTGNRGVYARFFGRPARTPETPFVLASRLGAALVPVLSHVDGDGRHFIQVYPEIPAPRDPNDERDVIRAVEAWHRVLEGAIRAHPEQWVWHHRRWKSRPEPTAIDLREFSKKELYLTENQRSRDAGAAR